MKRALTLIALGIVILTVAAAVGFFVVNTTPTRLDPSAAALIAHVHNHPEPPGNAYYPLLGIQLEGNGDASMKGRKLSKKLISLGADQRDQYVQKAFGGPAELPQSLECNLQQTNYLSCYQQNRDAIRRSMVARRVTLAAYSALIRDYHTYYDIGVDSITPDWMTSNLWAIHQLYRFRIVAEWHNGDTRRALSDLNHDILFWRMIFRNSDVMLTKFAVTAPLRRDYGLASDLLMACPKCRSMKIFRSMLTPLTREEMDPSPALRRDFVWLTDDMKKNAPRAQGSSWIYRSSIYQPNRIVNMLYFELQDEIRVVKAPPRQRAQMVKKLDAKYAIESGPLSWLRLYVHPIGKMITEIA